MVVNRDLIYSIDGVEPLSRRQDVPYVQRMTNFVDSFEQERSLLFTEHACRDLDGPCPIHLWLHRHYSGCSLVFSRIVAIAFTSNERGSFELDHAVSLH